MKITIKILKKVLGLCFKQRIESLDEDHKTGLNLLVKQINRHRLLVIMIFLFGVFAAISEGASIAILGIAGAAISQSSTVSLPVDMGQLSLFVNDWLASQERSTLFVVLISIAIVMQLLRSVLTYLAARLSIQLDFTIQQELWEKATKHLMSFSLSEIQSRTVGYTASIIHLSVQMTYLIGWGSKVLLIIYFLFMYFVLLLVYQSTFALILVGVTLIVSVAITRVLKKIRAFSKQSMEATLDVGRITFEYLQAPRLLRVFNATELAGKAINLARAKELNTNKKAGLNEVAVKPIVESTIIVGACVFLIGSYFVAGSSGESFVAGLTVFIVVLIRATPRISELNNARIRLARILPSLKIAGGFLRTDDKLFLRSGGKPFNGLRREISFDQLSFRYSNRDEYVLKDISFKVPKGSTIAVVGPSGAGKSTLMGVLLGLYSSTAGRILIDGVALEDIKLTDWLQHIGYVEQEVYLFNASIMENIKFGSMQATTKDVVAAAKQSYADDFIKHLPQGYDTKIGERGYLLSGGQKQRIGLARALIRKPTILLLDEATSALDSESERLIQRTLKELHSKCTTFIIAHRLSTAKEADVILVLDSGRVLEKGTVEQLLAYDSYFLRVSGMQGDVETLP